MGGYINESLAHGTFRRLVSGVRGWRRRAPGRSSSIIRYTLNEQQYCEWIEYTIRNNLDAPGVTNEAPPAPSHCTPITRAGDTLIFAPPGESVTTTYDRHGFTAVIKGQFTDHWRKIS